MANCLLIKNNNSTTICNTTTSTNTLTTSSNTPINNLTNTTSTNTSTLLNNEQIKLKTTTHLNKDKNCLDKIYNDEIRESNKNELNKSNELCKENFKLKDNNSYKESCDYKLAVDHNLSNSSNLNDNNLFNLNTLDNLSINQLTKLLIKKSDQPIDNRCCAEYKLRIKKELLKWSKNTLMFIGLQRVALELMGINKWNKLFSEINCLEELNESEDWKSDEDCLLCDKEEETINLNKNSISLFNNMTTTPLIMTNTNNSLTNDSDHINSFNTLISTDNMANQNETNDLNEINNQNENYQHTSDCQLKNYSNFLNQNKLNCTCMTNTEETIDLDNSSIKSETLSNGSNSELKMTINDQKPELNSLANLLTNNNILNSSNDDNKSNELLEQMVNQLNKNNSLNNLVNNLMGNQTLLEQPLDLSLNAGKSNEIDLNIISSYANDNSLTGKIKKTRLEGTKKRSYTDEELNKALNDIKSGRLGTRRAAALYKIPRSTLRNKVHKMNSLEGKKSITNQQQQTLPLIKNTNTTIIKSELEQKDENDSKHSTQSTSDQSTPANDSLRELLKKSISTKATNDTIDKNQFINNLDDNNNLQQNLDLSQLLNNLNNNNILGGNLFNNLLDSNNNNNNFLNNNLNINFNDLLNLQLLNQQSPQISLLALLNLQFTLMKQQDNQTFINNQINKTENDQSLNDTSTLDKSANSILSINSTSNKFNDQSIDKTNDDDETNSTIKCDGSKIGNLDNSNDDEQHSEEESNLSLIALDNQNNQFNSDKQKLQSTANLNESLNSNQSLNLTNNLTNSLMNNKLLFNLNLLDLANPANNLSTLNNPLGLAGLNNLGNLTSNFNFPIIDQTKQNNQNLGNDSASSNIDPNRKRPKRGRYRNYNKSDLDLAVKAVQKGEMSVHRAGTLFGVPHSTLEYKVKERHLLRPSKRLKKQQLNAALQAAAAEAARQQNLNQNDLNNSLNANNQRLIFSQDNNDLNTTGKLNEKLKNALIGNKPADHNSSSFDISSLQPFLQQQSNLTTSNLFKKLKDGQFF